MSEEVNHPSHYNKGSIEVIDAIEDWQLLFNDGNAVKYIARHRQKSKPAEDLKKALWYIARELVSVYHCDPVELSKSVLLVKKEKYVPLSATLDVKECEKMIGGQGYNSGLRVTKA